MPALALAISFLLFQQSKHLRSDTFYKRRNSLLIPGTLVTIIGMSLLFLDQFQILSKILGPASLTTKVSGSIIVLSGISAIFVRLQTVAAHVAALASLSIISVAAVHVATMPLLEVAFDLKPLAQRLSSWEHAGRPLAHYGKYHGQFHFLGRLHQPFSIIGDQEVIQWVHNNPKGLIISYHDQLSKHATPAASSLYREKIIGVWKATDVQADPRIVQRP